MRQSLPADGARRTRSACEPGWRHRTCETHGAPRRGRGMDDRPAPVRRETDEEESTGDTLPTADVDHRTPSDPGGGLFGAVAVRLGYCTEADLAAAIAAARDRTNLADPPRLGE